MIRRPPLTASPGALILALAVLLAAGCAEPIKLGRTIALSPESPRIAPRPLRTALVRPPVLVADWKVELPGLEKRVTQAVTEGLVTAAGWLAQPVSLVDTPPSAGYDYVIIPTNIHLEVDRGGRGIAVSMDVTLRRMADGKETGLLASGSAGPGKRPYATWQRGDAEVQLLGSPYPNPAFGQALNNALFEVCLDFAKKLDRRFDSMTAE